MERQWFERWFGEDYKALYPHRDEQQADGQVRALVEACSAPTSWRILDVACGPGRHLRSFRKRGFEKACGVDLSAVLLRDARNTGLAVARADMRRLPFADGTFDLLTCFFTSFGYFATRDEDASVLRGFARAIRTGGCMFLDLQNPVPVMRDLVPRDTQIIAGETVVVERVLEGDQVVKRIHCSGGDKVYEERVRLYSLSSLDPVLRNLNLSLLRIFGDENGAEFSSETSPRMSLLLRRA